MKKEIRQNISEIKKISNKFPKTLNEALNFNSLGEEDNIDVDDESIGETEPQIPKDNPVVSDNKEMDVMAFVDDIRKKSLKGMASLADNPDDERYQLLKKIWQICDKKPEQQTAFNKTNMTGNNSEI